MREVTFSGRWLRRKKTSRRWPAVAGWPREALAAFVTVGLIMLLVISTAFARSGPNEVAPAPVAQPEVEPEELGRRDNEELEPDPAWIERVRVLKAEQQEIQRALAEQRAREEAARAEEQARLAKVQARGSATDLTPEELARAQVIDVYLLERGSPMTGYGRTFIKAGKLFLVDPALVVAIAGKESSWGKYCFLPYNAWGWGNSSWLSWEQAINSYTYLLGEEYVSTGLNTIHEMAPVYCPPSNGSWERDVTTFYYELLALFAQSH